MEPQHRPEGGKPYKNGVDHAALARRATFAPRQWSFLWRAKLEMAVAIGVMAGVLAVFVYLVQIPGALVVRLQDDQKNNVLGAKVTCRHPEAPAEMSGLTDVFGEAKFPGLHTGVWTCLVEAPPRYFQPPIKTSGEVRPRVPAILDVRVTRGADVDVTVSRPEGGPRAKVAVRAVCPAEGDKPALGFEARTGLFESVAQLFLPPDRRCRIGVLAGGSGAGWGWPKAMALDCDRFPCSEELTGKVGEHLSVRLKPTAAQWEAARPPPVQEDPEPAPAPSPR